METAPPDYRQINEPEEPEQFILDFETQPAEQEKSKAKGFSAVQQFPGLTSVFTRIIR